MKKHVWIAVWVLGLAAGLNNGLQAGQHLGWMEDPVCHTVFQAVLEGLYTDGVTNDDVDCILAVDPQTQTPHYYTHFVYCCPLCLPTLEAFRLYRVRPEFDSMKEPVNTFGRGLDPAISKRLHSTDRTTRMTAIQEIVQQWITTRLNSMRLTPAEKEDWRVKLAALRKQGMDALEHRGERPFVGWKFCAMCDAAAAAGGNTCERTAMPFGELKPKTETPAVKPKEPLKEQF